MGILPYIILFECIYTLILISTAKISTGFANSRRVSLPTTRPWLRKPVILEYQSRYPNYAGYTIFLPFFHLAALVRSPKQPHRQLGSIEYPFFRSSPLFIFLFVESFTYSNILVLSIYTDKKKIHRWEVLCAKWISHRNYQSSYSTDDAAAAFPSPALQFTTSSQLNDQVFRHFCM